jgi:hypothetical protein
VIACLTWQHAPALIHPKVADAGQPAAMSPPVAGLAGTDAPHQTNPEIVTGQ